MFIAASHAAFQSDASMAPTPTPESIVVQPPSPLSVNEPVSLPLSTGAVPLPERTHSNKLVLLTLK